MATILIADDLPSVRLLVHLTLDRGHTVIEASDGATALELLRQKRPDIAILDVMMPALNGLQVCQHVKEDPSLAETRIIILSAHATEEEARQVGADRFLGKPFLPSQLMAAVGELARARVGGAPGV